MKLRDDRYLNLKIINILFTIVLTLLLMFYHVEYGNIIFENSMLSIVFFIGILIVVRGLGHLVEKANKFSHRIYYIWWAITIIYAEYSFLIDQKYMLFNFIILGVAVFSISEIKMMKVFIILYVVCVFPVVYLANVDFVNQAVFIIGLSVVMGFAYININHDERLILAYQDILQSKNQILDNAKESFALHRMIFDNNNKPINYKFIEVNKSFEKIIGKKNSDVADKTVLEVLPKTEAKWIEFYGSVVTDNKQKKMVDYASDLDKYFEVNAFPVGDDCFGVLFIDVTDRIQKEYALSFAVKQAEKADKLKVQFLKDINHRLRTPLNGMMGMLQLVDLDEVGAENRDLLGSMMQEMRHSRNIINQISKYVDLQSKGYEVISCNVLHVLEEEIERTGIEKKRISLDIADEYDDTMVYLHKTVLKSVMEEIISNAIKYSEKEQIEIQLKLDYDKESDRRNYVISVRDYGKGIGEAQKAYVFNEFYHHDFMNIYKEEEKFSLPMCKQMLISCGGDIYIDNKVYIGAKFVIEIPYFTKHVKSG